MNELEIPIRAAREVAMAHGVMPDRCEILQNGSTLVLRLGDLFLILLLNTVLGILSAVFPAWRAGKMSGNRTAEIQ